MSNGPSTRGKSAISDGCSGRLRMIRTYVLFWFVLLVVAVINGALREMTYGHFLSELRAHQLSTILAIILTGAAVWSFAHYYPMRSGSVALLIGAVWVTLTVAFEFTFGRYVSGHSWQKLFFDYNVLAGRMWPIFLLWILMLPYIVYRIGS